MLTIFYACSTEEFEQQPIIIDTNSVSVENRFETQYDGIRPVILGDEIINPYALSIVNEANALLYNEATTLNATHNYVKFLPQDQDDLAELDEWGFAQNILVLDYPMHYELIQQGDYYIDSEVTDSTLMYQYASIPVDMEMPQVPHQVLEELYLDESNPFIFIKTYLMTGHDDKLQKIVKGGITQSTLASFTPDNPFLCDINNLPPPPNCGDCEAVLLILSLGNGQINCRWECDCSPPPPPRLNGCGCPVPANIRIPAGCVRVDDDFGGDVPVSIVKVAVWDYSFIFKQSDVVWTDRAGCWEVDREYDEMNVKVIFENFNLKVRDLSYWLSLRVLRDQTRSFSVPLNNVLVVYDEIDDRRQWAASHTHNTDLDYRDRATTDGIPQPRTRINYLHVSGGGGAAAPMLQGNPANSFLSLLLSFYFPAAVLNILSSGIQPDIANQYADGEDARNFNGITHHELGHASHYNIEGESYWFHYRNHIINNVGYGTFPGFTFVGSSPGRVALGEAVGNFMGNRYGNTFAGGENLDFRNNFIPVGLMFDLGDGGSDEIVDPNNTVIRTFDNVEGFTPAMIFDALEGSTDIENYGENLRILHLASTPSTPINYNNLIEVYDVFN